MLDTPFSLKECRDLKFNFAENCSVVLIYLLYLSQNFTPSATQDRLFCIPLVRARSQFCCFRTNFKSTYFFCKKLSLRSTLKLLMKKKHRQLEETKGSTFKSTKAKTCCPIYCSVLLANVTEDFCLKTLSFV